MRRKETCYVTSIKLSFMTSVSAIVMERNAKKIWSKKVYIITKIFCHSGKFEDMVSRVIAVATD